MTILESIQNAASDEQIRELFNLGNSMKPSGLARRDWLRAAKQRRKELQVPLLKRWRDAVANNRLGRKFFKPVQAQPEPKPIIIGKSSTQPKSEL